MEEKQMKLEYIEKYPFWKIEKENIYLVLKRARNIVPSMKLYKYRSGLYNNDGTNYDLQNLKDDKIRFTNMRNFNDPFECKVICKDIVDSLDEELSRFTKFLKVRKEDKQKIINEAHNELIRSCNKTFLDNLLICSFSECNDNILMWSHYSNCHKGFCIEYDFEQLIKKRAMIFPIIYSKKVPDIDKSHIGNSRYSRIYTKSLDWEYEKEWRFISIGDSEGVNLRIDKPKAIYLGCNITKRLEEDLIKICKDKEINCYKAKKDSYEYKLNFEEVLVK
ncbi:DUF2971 domain-containing protein [Clostridium perfringens]|uniref:DUF2971 domain-containing protein n=1 Tax=Clostridium perfringens TaxID=1502 RepID=UPI000BBB2F54|nr:DUF2971 domain-containing protein [Clostridium perfringens]